MKVKNIIRAIEEASDMVNTTVRNVLKKDKTTGVLTTRQVGQGKKPKTSDGYRHIAGAMKKARVKVLPAYEEDL